MPITSKKPGSLIPPFVTLAGWQLQRMWGLLLTVGLGMLAAMVVVCVAPLYSQVATTAGLRDTLDQPSTTQTSNTIFSSDATRVQSTSIRKVGSALDQEMHQKLGPYLGKAHLSLETSLYTPVAGQSALTKDDLLRFVSEPMDQTQQHLTLAAGQLPQARPGVLEVALTTESARLLHVKVGSTFAVTISSSTLHERIAHVVQLRVSGLFLPTSALDPFWHGNTFLHSQKNEFTDGLIYSLLASNDALISTLQQSTSQSNSTDTLELPIHLYWLYPLDSSRITSEDLDTLLSGFNAVQADVANRPDLVTTATMERVKTLSPMNILLQYRDQSSVLFIPVGGLVSIIFVLILYFVALMTDFLVERQGPALAVLRSRGASRGQLFGALMVQGIGVGLLTLLTGPWLGIIAVRLISLRLLDPRDRSGLDLILNNTGHVLLSIWWYVLGVVVVALLTMLLAISRTSVMDVLSMRREAARGTQRPFWQRFNLDLVAVIVMLAGYAISFYTTSSDVLDAHLTLILYSPLVLARTAFTIVAAILLFLRIFPYVLRMVSLLTQHARGASSMVALAQMARSPGQSVRMTMLLALATAFTIFSIIFYSSQTQRAYDVAAFQSGSDFSGSIPLPLERDQLASRTSAYLKVPGVRAASLGYTVNGLRAGSAVDRSVSLWAVDSPTFARTVFWPQDNSTQSLTSLMAQLSSRANNAQASGVVPALVDSTLWDALGLKPGQQFVLKEADAGQPEIHFIALARVNYIPGVRDTSGVLVDFQTYASVYDQVKKDTSYIPVKANFAWIRTADDARSLASVRAVLASGDLQLSPLNDRRVLISDLHREPLYMDLIGILSLGATTALLLALIGNFIASWLSARGRIANFAILRALGAAPRQVASVLTWEQAIIYSTSIVLGVLFGAFLSLNVVPSLLYTSPPNTDFTSQEFFLLQNIPPIQIIVPVLSGLALAAIVGICIVALGMMVRVVSHPSISQVLRLNED